MNTYQYDLVEKLSFLRYGGTDNELTAAKILLDEIKKAGGEGSLEEFKAPACRFNRYSVTVTAPYEQKIETLPLGMSGSLPEKGVDLKLFYAEDCSEAALYGKPDLSDRVVLVDSLDIDQYKALCERNAAAVLVIWGKWYQTAENADLLLRNIRLPYQAFGKIPTLYVWARDALEMVKNEAEILHIELEQEELENTSHNVIATIKGSEITDESVVITAHYDSVSVGTGSWDNATGTATAMYIYRYFLTHPPKRTMRFMWCGSEEQGLLGSKAYALAHPEIIENEIKLGFNFDMCGTVLGSNQVCVTGGDDLKHYAEAFCREYGINARVYQEVRSSDSAVFADKGIPTLDLIRKTSTADIHIRHDLIDTLSAKQLKKDGDFAVSFIERVVNSARLPVSGDMPKEMTEKLDKYFLRDKMPKEEKQA